MTKETQKKLGRREGEKDSKRDLKIKVWKKGGRERQLKRLKKREGGRERDSKRFKKGE